MLNGQIQQVQEARRRARLTGQIQQVQEEGPVQRQEAAKKRQSLNKKKGAQKAAELTSKPIKCGGRKSKLLVAIQMVLRSRARAIF
jgi:hypothetical protein